MRRRGSIVRRSLRLREDGMGIQPCGWDESFSIAGVKSVEMGRVVFTT
jgi:hypothetical protein